MSDSRMLMLDKDDNVAMASCKLEAGTELSINSGVVMLHQSVDIGHKFAAKDIAEGEKIIKYQAPIGHAIRVIKAGEYVHTHNMVSDYLPTYTIS